VVQVLGRGEILTYVTHAFVVFSWHPTRRRHELTTLLRCVASPLQCNGGRTLWDTTLSLFAGIVEGYQRLRHQ
jgi:hypothetical protein